MGEAGPGAAVDGADLGPEGRIVEAAPAKLNLGLCVLGRRDDGYHEIDSVMASVEPADELELRPAPELPEGTVRVTVTGPGAGELERSGLPPTESVAVEAQALGARPLVRNLVLRAAVELARWAAQAGAGAAPPTWPGVHIRLTKRIPAGAGLGGGSSDAAAALRGLNRLWGLGLGPSELESVAARVGADVAFCVRGGVQRARGIGERLEPLPCRVEAACVIVVPEASVSTPEAYRLWDEAHRDGRPAAAAAAAGCPEMDALAQALADGDLERVLRHLRNDLAAAACRLSPVTGRLLALLREVGCPGAAVTGSGSAAFAVVAPERAADLEAVLVRRLEAEGIAGRVFVSPLPAEIRSILWRGSGTVVESI